MNTDLFAQNEETLDPIDDLQYKDETVEALVNNIHEYLSFSTARDLIKLVAANL
jgi:hypothetical protein